jgi:drug/metabolite transporter (DMT)-like permease
MRVFYGVVSRASPHLLLAVTALFWAAHWIVARAVIPHSTPISMAFWRWAGAIALLAPFAGRALVHEWPAVRRAWLPILFFGTCGTMIYNCIGYTGIRSSTATNAVLFQSVTPGVIPLFAWLFFRERIRLRTAGGLALSFAGVLAIVSHLDLARLAALELNPGDLWLLANTALWALYTACMRYMPRGIDPPALMLALMIAGMVTGLPVYAWDLATGGGIEPTAGVALGILYLSAVTSILCYLLWNRGVAAIGPAKAGAYLHLIPLAGALMAVVFLGERIEAYHVVGLVLILSGVAIVSRKG